MADPSPLPGRAASNQGSPSDLDSVDLIQRAWERERPGTPAASIGVITRIWRIGKLLADERRRTLARLGIDAATLDLLSTLRRAGPPYRLTASAVAAQSLVSAGAISQRVARAEREGLVRRERSDADGRLSYVTLATRSSSAAWTGCCGTRRPCCPPSPASSAASCPSSSRSCWPA